MASVPSSILTRSSRLIRPSPRWLAAIPGSNPRPSSVMRMATRPFWRDSSTLAERACA